MRATAAQARLIAALWGRGEHGHFSEHSLPSLKVCVRNGWLTKNGQIGIHPNGTGYEHVIVSEAGIKTLEHFLFETRCSLSHRPRKER